MNRARQDAITTEIMEIVGGAEALGDDAETVGELVLHHLDTEHIAGNIGSEHATPDTYGHVQDMERTAEAALAVALVEDGPFGRGSALPRPDGSAPSEGFTIKGNADSMLYHRPDSRSYAVTKAEVWFDSVESAEAAGFAKASTHPEGA